MTDSDKLDIEAIMRQLPHRYPFLLVDRVLECVSGKHVHALKNVTFNEPYFQGHFPHRPVMPGVIIIEALAQAAGILAFKTVGIVPDTNTRFYFVAIDNARFRKPVEPGDQLLLKVTLKRAFKGIWKFHGSAEVDGVEVAASFREPGNGGPWHISFRSRGRVNVAAIAQAFGGGGHHNAAGCSIDGEAGEVRARIAEEIERALNVV